MFRATVENLDSSISPRSISVVESRTRSSVFSSTVVCDVAKDAVNNSPNGVTEDVDVDPDRSVELLNAGVGTISSFEESVSRRSSDSPSSVFRLSVPESESNEKRKARQHWTDRILSLSRRTEFGIVSFGIRRLGQLNRGCRNLDVRHQEQPWAWKCVRFMAKRGRFQSRLTTLPDRLECILLRPVRRRSLVFEATQHSSKRRLYC